MNNKENSKDRREEIEFRALESNGKALLDREVIETFLIPIFVIGKTNGTRYKFA